MKPLVFLTLTSALLLPACARLSPSTRRLRTSRQLSDPTASKLAASIASGVFDVHDYGASGDGTTDNTGAFQAALNAAAAAGGGQVLVGGGKFLFKGSLQVPVGVTLTGTFGFAPSHPIRSSPYGPLPSQQPANGSVLMPTAFQGNDQGQPFITLQANSMIHGFTVFYPAQNVNNAPIAFPWSLDLVGDNIGVTDMELLNCWNGIRADAASRHYIARVEGQPANIGLYVNDITDIGRTEDIHWNPWFSDAPTYMHWQLTYGQGFVIARTDWQYAYGLFAFGYAVGYSFVESPQGSCNGEFTGIGADMCPNASVLVQAADPWGILITGGEFTSFIGPNWGNSSADHSQVVVTDSNAGAVRFVNSAFWGPSNTIAQVAGTGLVGFSDCTFNYWNADGSNRAAIVASSGRLILNGNEFQHSGKQASIAREVTHAVVTGNVMNGKLQVDVADAQKTDAQVGYNSVGGF